MNLKSDTSGQTSSSFPAEISSSDRVIAYVRKLLGLALVAAIQASIFFAIWSELDRRSVGLVAGLITVVVTFTIWISMQPPKVSGRIRLTLELGIAAVAVYGLWITASRAAGETLLTFLLLHYAVTWDRVKQLLSNT